MKKLVAAKGPDWPRIFEEWKQSGLSQPKFCEKKGLSYTLFCHRRVELNKRERQAARLYPAQKKVGQFIPVTVEAKAEEPKTVSREPNSPAPEIVVELPFGVVLRFRGMAQQ